MEYQLIDSKFSTNNPIERVFFNRGFTSSEEIDHYLHTTRQDILDPSLIDNIDKGAKMLIKHLAQGSHIFVQVDADADGYTSAAALLNYLNFLFPGHVQQNITYRVHTGKQHGIILDTIPQDVKLVIVPDAGSNDLEQQKILQEQGIDVLIIDHHEIDHLSTYACIINNQSCSYPNKTLSGAGMVYKFCQYLDLLMQVDFADKILDLAMTGLDY